MKKDDFLYFTHDERDEALKINPNINPKIIEVKDTNMWYVSCEDVFVDLDRAVDFLRRFPAYKRIVTVPGSRQYFHPVEVEPLTLVVQDICRVMYPNNKFIKNKFSFGSIIANKDDQVYENCWYPHADFWTVACQVYLNEYNGGTAFYKWRGTTHHSETAEHLAPNYHRDLGFGGKYHTGKLKPWKKFEGDEDWELYHVIPGKPNSLAVFHGSYYHSTYTEFEEEYRYVLSGFHHQDNAYCHAESFPIDLNGSGLPR